jgi:Tat protein translocase TatB subunit
MEQRPMPSIGPTEVLLVLVIALLVLGPHRLPDMARQLGRGIRQFRETARNVTHEMGAEDLVDDLKGLNQARGTFGETVRKELGLDELGSFPDLEEVGKDKPAIPAEPPVVPAADAATALAADPPAAPLETSPDTTAAPATDAPPARKRTRKAAAAATTGDETAAASATSNPTPAKTRPARKRAAKPKPSEPA